MKCIILAAGYATRMYPLTLNFPKPLLDVKGKAVLDWIVDDISINIDQFIVISNHKFYNHFKEWADNRPEDIAIVDDGTITNEGRLGAVKDIKLAIDTLNIDEDVLIIAGDNLLDFSLNSFIDYARNIKATCTMRYYEPDLKKMSKSAELILDGDLVLEMNEKPTNPKSNWCSPAFYYYVRDDIKRIDEALESGISFDAPGSLLSYMVSHSKVYAYSMPGRRFDIGSIETYEKIKEEYVKF